MHPLTIAFIVTYAFTDHSMHLQTIQCIIQIAHALTQFYANIH